MRQVVSPSPETSVTYCQPAKCEIPERRRTQTRRGVRLRPRIGQRFADDWGVAVVTHLQMIRGVAVVTHLQMIRWVAVVTHLQMTGVSLS